MEIKWGKEVYKNVEVDLEAPPSAFRETIQRLTKVAPERQKGLSPLRCLVYVLLTCLVLVMLPGGALKDDWTPFKGKLKTV